jgi:hypothetical protein
MGLAGFFQFPAVAFSKVLFTGRGFSLKQVLGI